MEINEKEEYNKDKLIEEIDLIDIKNTDSTIDVVQEDKVDIVGIVDLGANTESDVLDAKDITESIVSEPIEVDMKSNVNQAVELVVEDLIPTDYNQSFDVTEVDESFQEKEASGYQEDITHKQPVRNIKKIMVRISISLFTTLLLLFIFLLGSVMIINYGPSKTVRNLFVNSVMESSAGKFLATSFFSDEEIKAIRAENSVVASNEVTNSDLITIESSQTEVSAQVNPIEVIDLTESTYKGKMLIVHDPSRVTVGVSGNYGSSYSGKTVKDMAISYNAVAATNGGGFADAGGMGNGGTPIGIVISDGKIKFGSLYSSYEIIGMDNQNKLVVGNMTGQQALDRGVRDALSFGPVLIVNGQPSVVNGTGSGLNPRTAIGQRADGAIILLVIDGRQTNSLGATYADLVEIMLKYGAVNAANLDGGSSSLLYYNGEYINSCSSLYGPRNMPTSIIVR